MRSTLFSRVKRSGSVEYAQQYLREVQQIAAGIDPASVAALASLLRRTRDGGGRVFVLGVGGSAGSASHAVNDFRKIAAIEAYAPTDNVSELTARINDEGWDTSLAEWLKVSRLRDGDLLFVLSVGGGDEARSVSVNLVRAIEYARSVGALVGGIVGRDGGYTHRNADACVLIPTVRAEAVTPHTEAFHGVIWHLLVSHPDLQVEATKWETLAR